ncbi:MAG: hypothetical protein R2831_03280 [Chitinophagaceae bacterium]
MNNKRLYYYIIILLLINLFLVGFFLMRSHVAPPHKSPETIIIKKLQFDKIQQKEYHTLVLQHQKDIRVQEDSLRFFKNALYKTLQNNDTLTKEALLQNINNIHEAIEHIHYQHFLAIKSLCKPNQLSDFNAFTEEIAKLFAPHRKPR